MHLVKQTETLPGHHFLRGEGSAPRGSPLGSSSNKGKNGSQEEKKKERHQGIFNERRRGTLGGKEMSGWEMEGFPFE